MQMHTVQQLQECPCAGLYVYTGGNSRMGRHVECCAEAWLEVLKLPAEEREASTAWERIGHDTADEAYAHMRTVLLDRLDLERQSGDWSGCTAPVNGRICDTPTKHVASIPPMHFQEALCDEHRSRETVEAMWEGPGDWSGSW
ncbi:hypothetical protein [Streptomyces sp. NPDC005302]|uniref:hypothetical protein n=1 Tax=Streptomyces sp. NPDC005302 TaxID=3154675 RepID=UPI0033BCAD8B